MTSPYTEEELSETITISRREFVKILSMVSAVFLRKETESLENAVCISFSTSKLGSQLVRALFDCRELYDQLIKDYEEKCGPII